MNVSRVVKNQNMIFDILKSAKLNNRLSHAYLFYGDEGVGKKEMAYALACLLYCPNGGCLECEVCSSIINNKHMNVDYIGIDDKKTMISKEQITNLQEEFSKTSLVDGTRIYIVDGIDTASNAAQNSLLKFIEEPVNQTPTIGVFIAKELSNVVPTILSRCALVHFKALSLDKSVAYLTNEGLELFDAILVASLTNNLDEALDIAKTESYNKTKALFLDFLNLNNPRDGVLYFINNVSFFSDSNNLLRLLQWILLFLEDANLECKSKDDLILSSLYDKIIEYKANNEKTLKNKMSIVLNLFDRLKYNATAKNVFHELVVKMI